MNVSEIILQFARACKDAQNMLNEDGKGGEAGNVPILIKEVEFKYNIQCSLNIESNSSVSATFFRVKAQQTLNVQKNTTEGLDLRILFVSEMVLTNETVPDAK